MGCPSHALEKAINAARRSYFEQFRHGATIYHTGTGRIVSVGRNHWRDNHAEEVALRTVHPREDMSDLAMVVVRLNREGELRLSEPCEDCKRLIDQAGLDHVYYSVSESADDFNKP